MRRSRLKALLSLAREKRAGKTLMRQFTTPITILLLVIAALACSTLRPKRPLDWLLTLEIEGSSSDREAAMNQTIAVLESRLNALGVSSFEVRPQGDPRSGRILVRLPSDVDRERLKKILTAGGKLELVHVISPPSPAPAQTYATREEAIASLNSRGTVPPNHRVLPYADRAELAAQEANSNAPKTNKRVVVESPAIVDGSELRTASAVQAYRGSDEYEIQFSLKKSGADKFGAWTGANINEYLGVVLNDEVKSIAFIKSQIFDRGEINGRFTKQSAEDLALILKSGALPASVKIVEEGKN
jgi:preprotein translocase subunit SecD